MKHLFQAATAEEVKARIERLTPASERLWGKMSAAQALTHCSIGFEFAMGVTKPQRAFLGYLVGWMVKPKVLEGDEPLRKNTPTLKELIITDDRDLRAEQEKLIGWIDKFAKAGPPGCTDHPHSFFGKLKPEEWAVLMYKHTDHHLRQFGV